MAAKRVYIVSLCKQIEHDYALFAAKDLLPLHAALPSSFPGANPQQMRADTENRRFPKDKG